MAIMDEAVERSTDNFVEGISQLFYAWGLSKSMGTVFAYLYLTQGPTALDDIAKDLHMSKGNVSLNIREVERLGMVRKIWNKGDRRDFYEVEDNLWKIVRNVSRERQKREFELAVETVRTSLELIPEKSATAKGKFARKRLKNLGSFLRSVNRIVNGVLSMDSLRGVTVACPVLSRISRPKREAETTT